MSKDYEEMESEELVELLKTQDAKVIELQDKVDQADQFSTVLADPNVRRILQAQEEGKAVRILLEDNDDDKPRVEEKSPEAINDMTNAELMAHMTQTLTGELKGLMTSALTPVTQRLESVEGRGIDEDRNKLRMEVQKAKAKYKDWDTYAKDIGELYKSYPDLPIDQLYIKARLDKGHGLPGEDDTFSERPRNDVSHRPSAESVVARTEYKAGPAGFKAMLGDAADEIDYSAIIQASASGVPAELFE